jgi:hypothetical protein
MDGRCVAERLAWLAQRFPDTRWCAPLAETWWQVWPSPRETTLSGAKHRQKGDRVERQIVEAIKKAGIHAERYPLSGSTAFRGSSHDLDVYAFGKDETPMTFESKARKTGEGFGMLERWLGDYDGVFVKRNNALPRVYLSFEAFLSLLIGKWMCDAEVADKGAKKGGSKESPESPTP